MSEVSVRPMTESEFDRWQRTIAEEFAAEQVAAGRWAAEGSIRGAPGMAFLYDIEVVEQRRGFGLGRALLAAVEDAVMDAGVSSLELNVFGRNLPAVALYDSAGYVVSTQQMQKHLRR